MELCLGLNSNLKKKAIFLLVGDANNYPNILNYMCVYSLLEEAFIVAWLSVHFEAHNKVIWKNSDINQKVR